MSSYLTYLKQYVLIFCFLSVFSSFPVHGENHVQELPIVVVIPSYNNYQWCKQNLESVLNQKYSNYRIIYINDSSTDSTQKKVKHFLVEHGVKHRFVNFSPDKYKNIASATLGFSKIVNAKQARVTVVKNTKRSGAMANFYRAIHSCSDKEIVVVLDGDDWFYHDEVFSQLNEIYQTQNVWLTHGRLVEHPSGHSTWCEPVPKNIVSTNRFREFKCPSHLRTFYAWLFKKVKLQDFLYKGKFLTMTCDMAMMFPMIEMAAERHYFVQEINYVYNMSNPINDNKVDAALQMEMDAYIRGLKPYKRL